jgi:hypothetical protein
MLRRFARTGWDGRTESKNGTLWATGAVGICARKGGMFPINAELGLALSLKTHNLLASFRNLSELPSS